MFSLLHSMEFRELKIAFVSITGSIRRRLIVLKVYWRSLSVPCAMFLLETCHRILFPAKSSYGTVCLLARDCFDKLKQIPVAVASRNVCTGYDNGNVLAQAFYVTQMQPCVFFWIYVRTRECSRLETQDLWHCNQRYFLKTACLVRFNIQSVPQM